MQRPFRFLAGPLFALLVLALTTPLAQAGQYFVNSSSGSDANSGGTPAQAFKTIGKALSVATQANDLIQLAAGDYSAASGELFPLLLGSHRLVGAPAPGVTRILGSGTDLLFDATCPGDPAGSMLQISDLTLQGGRTGLRVNTSENQFIVGLWNVSIHDMAQDGIESHTFAGRAAQSLTHMFLQSVTISGCLRGLRFETDGASEGSYVSVGLSRLHHNFVGIDLLTTDYTTLQVLHSRIEDNNEIGVRGFSNGSGNARVDVLGSLVARNGIGIDASGLNSDRELLVSGCTVTGNTIVGITTDLGLGTPTLTRIFDSIVWGNKDDVSLAGPVEAAFNDIGDGGLGTSDGNFSADPLFRNAAAGDYRLSWGSPAIGAAAPVDEFQLSQDIAGTVRPSDSDFDTEPEADLGCLEFAALDLIGTPNASLMVELHPGDTLRLESWGPAGSHSLLLLALGGFSGCPFSTAFGSFFLNPSGFVALATLPVGPVTPGVLQAAIPLVPSLDGLNFSFQGVTTSSLAPQGKALTNPAQFGVRN